MEDSGRKNPLFSLCGLNCGLCSMHLGGYCPGCGGGAGNQPCAIARCSQEHGNVEYCFECGGYPCKKYEGFTKYDSFITHQNQPSDMDKARQIGIDAYRTELVKKMRILAFLLEGYNDGRRKTLFCLAVNLLALPCLELAFSRIEADTQSTMTIKEKAVIAVKHLEAAASECGITLKLRKKPKG